MAAQSAVQWDLYLVETLVALLVELMDGYWVARTVYQLAGWKVDLSEVASEGQWEWQLQCHLNL
jgi:hypothetical protein